MSGSCAAWRDESRRRESRNPQIDGENRTVFQATPDSRNSVTSTSDRIFGSLSMSCLDVAV